MKRGSKFLLRSLRRRIRLWLGNFSESTRSALQPLHPLDVVKRNTPAAFDFYWKSNYGIQQYMEPARQRMLAQIGDIIASSASGLILDVGCGPGHLCAYVAMKRHYLLSGHMIGVDYSQVATEQARQRVAGAVFMVATASRLPYKAHVFCCTSCVETLEHVLNPKSVAEELERVTTIGGTIVVSVPNGELDRWDGHRHFFTCDSLRELFSNSHLVSCELVNEDRVILMILRR